MDIKKTLAVVLCAGVVVTTNITVEATSVTNDEDEIPVITIETNLYKDALQKEINKIEAETIEKNAKMMAEEKEKQAIEAQKAKEKKRQELKNQKPTRGKSVGVPNNNTSFKSYMPYKAITNKSAPQYRVNRIKESYTDSMGMRRVRLSSSPNEKSDDYVIAMGTYYGKPGDRVRVKMGSGKVITATIGDIKANQHTDSSNRQHRSDGSVVEFLIDRNSFKGMAKRMGDISYLKYSWSNGDEFKGRITSVEVIGDNVLNWK